MLHVPWPPMYAATVPVAFADGPNLDAFSRLRAALPITAFDQALEFGIAQLFWNSVTSGGGSSVTHDGNRSNVILTCGTGAADSCARQTFEYLHYRPGKGIAIFLTATFGAAVANLGRRMGYYDAQNGIFLEQNGTTDVAIVKRSFTTGVVVATRVVQASWSLDRLDGTGPSRETLDLSKGQILVIDLQWLGYGRIRVGFDIGGQIVYCHEFKHANLVTEPYMTTASLPVRFEIFNTAAQGVAHTMLQGCSNVMIEGATDEEKGIYFTVNNGTTPITVTTRRAILSIRPKATIGPSAKVNRVPITLDEIGLITKTNDCLWEVVYNPTFNTGAGALTWTDPGTQSAVEYCVHGDANAGGFTVGIPILSGYSIAGSGATSGVAQAGIKNKLPITLDAAGANPIAMSLVCTSMGGNSVNAGHMCWKEVR